MIRPNSTKIAQELPEISSPNPAVKKLLEGLFRDVRKPGRDWPFVSFNLVWRNLEDVAGKWGEHVPLKIVYEGQKISFAFGGNLNARFFNGHRSSLYYNTNEKFGKVTEEVLGSVTGITHYAGIAGGLAALPQLGILSKTNKLRSQIELLDRSPYQVVFDAMRLFVYDKLPAEKLTAAYSFGEFSDISNYPQNIPAISLIVGDIFAAVHSLTEEGRYFIYLSNAFPVPIFRKDRLFYVKGAPVWEEPSFYTMGSTFMGNYTVSLLNSMVDNDAVLDGSYLMFAEHHSFGTLLVRKEGGSLIPVAFIPLIREEANYTDRPIGEQINLLGELEYFASKSVESALALMKAKRPELAENQT